MRTKRNQSQESADNWDDAIGLAAMSAINIYWIAARIESKWSVPFLPSFLLTLTAWAFKEPNVVQPRLQRHVVHETQFEAGSWL